MTMLYKIFWKHKDFSKHSEEPVLRHSRQQTTFFGMPYTRRVAERVCRKFNRNEKVFKTKDEKGKLVKLPVVTHWVEEVLA